MKDSIYLFKSGELKRKDNTIAYVLNNSTTYFPIEQIDHIHSFGEIKLNKRILDLLSSYKIGLTFYNRYGRCIGRFTPKTYRRGKDILLQSQAYLDNNIRNNIVFSIENASFDNCINVVKYYKKEDYELDNILNKLNEERDNFNKLNIKSKDYVNKAMLIEARFKQIYYQMFDVVLENNSFSFIKRTAFPPANEVNAAMSFLYSLLYSDVLNAIERSRLIPEISFIHGNSRNNNGGLQYDIADYLKPHIIDRLMLRLFRSNKLDKECFYCTSSNSCFLNEKGKSIIIKAYHKQLKTSVIDKRNERKYTYKQFIYREINELMKGIKNESLYKTIVFRY